MIIPAMVSLLQEGGVLQLPDSLSQPGRLPTSIELAAALTLLSVLPAVLVSVTCFTRIIIVLSFVRRAMSLQELPPNQVLLGLSMFLTLFVMYPTGSQIYDRAVVPYLENRSSVKEACETGGQILETFLLKHTRDADLELFADIGKVEIPKSRAELPLRVVIPAYLLSELKTAFTMGFLIFLPFVLIDLVVSSVLLSMGMFMLPPPMISTPLKVLLFVLVDGWNLIVRSLVTSVSI